MEQSSWVVAELGDGAAELGDGAAELGDGVAELGDEWPSWVMEYSCWSHLVFVRANVASCERVATTLNCWVKVMASRRWWYRTLSVIAAGNGENGCAVSDWK